MSTTDIENIEWNKANITKLIELFREQPVLWNASNKDYKNRNKKFDAWQEISLLMRVERGEVEKKIRCLIGQFQRNSKNISSGSAADNDRKWPYFNLLSFLKDKSKPRQFIDTGNMGETLHSEKDDKNELPGPSEPNKCGTQEDPENTNRPPQPKKKQQKVTHMAEEAYNVMKMVSALLENKKHDDEYDIFGKNVAVQIRNLKSKLDQAEVKFKIHELLYTYELKQLRSQSDSRQSSNSTNSCSV